MQSDQIFVSSTSSCTVTGTLCMVLKGKTSLSYLPLWPWYMSLSYHEAYKRSLILKLWSWRSRGKNIEI